MRRTLKGVGVATELEGGAESAPDVGHDGVQPQRLDTHGIEER